MSTKRGLEIIRTTAATNSADRGIPLSQAVRAGDFIFVSGQVPLSPDGRADVEGINAQTHLCLQNIKAILEAAGASLADVVKVQVFLTDMANFPEMNEVYKEYFPSDPPARSAFGVKHLGRVESKFLVEIEAIAYHPQ